MIIIFITIMDSWCFMGQGTTMILIEIIAILTMTIIVTIISASWWFMGLGTTMCTLNTQCCFPKLLSIIKSSSGTFHQPKFCHLILCFKHVLLASLFSIPLYMYRVFILWEECLTKECFLCLCEEIYEFRNQIVVADSRSTLTRRTACPG